MAHFSKEQIQEANRTNLIEYARMNGYDLKKSSGGSFKVEGFGGLYLWEKGFNHFSEEKKGNVIQFVMEYEGKTFPQAVEELLGGRAFYQPVEEYTPRPPKVERGEMEMPSKSLSDKQVMKYLVEERCLDWEIVNNLINKGSVFQASTQRGEMKFTNCAFVGFDENKKPKYCSLRSMGKSNFRQDLKNSDKSYPFVIEGRSNRVFVTESPVDCISHATLTKLNNRDYTEDWRISVGGLFDSGLERFLEQNPQITSIVFAFDNDIDGKDYKNNPHNHGQVFAQKSKEKFQEKGYRTMVQVPQQKDFNMDLQSIVRAIRQQQAEKTTPPPTKRAEVGR